MPSKTRKTIQEKKIGQKGSAINKARYNNSMSKDSNNVRILTIVLR